MVLKMLSNDTRRHSNVRSTRPRDQQLQNEGHDTASGQPRGEAYRPPPVVPAMGSTSGIVPAGAAKDHHQQHQQQSIPGGRARMLPLYHNTLMPYRDWWAIPTAHDIAVIAGTSQASNLGAYRPDRCGAAAAAWKFVTD